MDRRDPESREQSDPFGSDLWKAALDRFADATGLTVELFGLDGRVVLGSTHLTPLMALFREHGFKPGLFEECARRCMGQTYRRPLVVSSESNGLVVVGTSLVLEGEVVGAAVAGYGLTRFSQVDAAQRWAKSARIPFDRLWNTVRGLPPLPERRLLVNGELLQVLADALLRENHRSRQFEEAAAKLRDVSAAKDEFMAILSHELRAPLAPILVWAQVLKTEQGGARTREAAEVIERNARLQARLIDDLLDLNLIEHGTVKLEPRVVDLGGLVRDALERSAAEVGRKAIVLDLAIPGEPLCVEGDPVRLQQVFGNILSNAVKFTPERGGIRVAATKDGNEARVVVADTGAGIAPEFLPHVFEIFRQQEHGTRRSHQGLGIGLALVKRLTELHGGSVDIESAGAGRGTQLTVRLPLAAESPAVPQSPGAGRSALDGRANRARGSP